MYILEPKKERINFALPDTAAKDTREVTFLAPAGKIWDSKESFKPLQGAISLLSLQRCDDFVKDQKRDAMRDIDFVTMMSVHWNVSILLRI